MGPSTFWVVFVDGRPQIHGAVHVWGRFCGREASNSWGRPRFGPFLWTGGFKFMGPSTFWAVFVDGMAASGLLQKGGDVLQACQTAPDG